MIDNSPGFSLIELMVVIAIVGILAAVAAPSYRDYVIRSQVAAGMSLAEQYKKKVQVEYETLGSLPANGATNFPDIANPGENVTTLTWRNAPPLIAVELWFTQLASDMDASPVNNQVHFYPDLSQNGIFNWRCGVPTNATHRMPCKYLPSNCDFNCP